MNRFKTATLCVLFAALMLPLLGPSTAQAGQSITFIHEGTTEEGFILDGEPFPGQYDFIITAFGNVGDRQEFDFGFFIEHESALIEIVGVGSFGILVPTQTFVNQSSGLVGFSFSGSPGRDLFTGPAHSDFLEWDMTTPIGPIAGDDGRLTQWNQEPFIETTGGILRFANEENLPVTFTAMVVPGPGPIALLPLAAILCPRRRRR